MKIYGHPLSTCTRKILITLAEKGVQGQLDTIDLFTGEHKQAAHLARHPFGVIPVLDDDGFMLFESRAIIRYLDSKLDGTRLTPSAPRDVARMDQWLSVDQSYIAPHTRTLAVERVVKKHGGLPGDVDAERSAESALSNAFGAIDRALAGDNYLAGSEFSLADVSLLPYVAALPMIAAEHLIADRPHLRAWFERVRARPSCNGAL